MKETVLEILQPPKKPGIMNRLKNLSIGTGPAIFNLKDGPTEQSRYLSVMNSASKLNAKTELKFQSERGKGESRHLLYVWRVL